MIIPRLHQPQNILLAVDGSEHAQAAAKLLCDLPLPKGSTITALAVLIPRNASDHAILEAALERIQSLLQNKGVEVKAELQAGYPAERINEYAIEHRPDLTALGAKGLRATLGILLGGVAQQVVEYSCCPVLVVRSSYAGLRRIALVTDGSTSSQHALDYLTHFPVLPEAEIDIVHVLAPPPVPEAYIRPWPVGTEIVATMPPSVPVDLENLLQEEAQAGQAILARGIETLERAGINARSTLLQGDAATEIIEYARNRQIDLLISGSRGLSPVKGWLLGSVSRKLLHYAGCSVLVVK